MEALQLGSSSSIRNLDHDSTVLEINNSDSETNIHDSTPERAVDLLYWATLTGDWSKARPLIDEHPAIVRALLNSRDETSLLIAVAAQQTTFVEELVRYPQDLRHKNIFGLSALCFAAVSGSVRIGKAIVSEDSNLPNLLGFKDSLPLGLALTYRRTDMAYYLFSVTDLSSSGSVPAKEKIKLLHAAILSDYYDIGMRILEDEPELALERNKDNGMTALHALAKREPSAITGSISLLGTCNNKVGFKRSEQKLTRTYNAREMVMFMCKTFMEKIPKTKERLEFMNTPSSFLDDAAKVGNAEFLRVFISLCPHLILWNLDDNKSIFHIAVEFRQESVFKLIHEIGGIKIIIAKFLDSGNENMLYLAARLPAREHLEKVSNGAFLQLQREVYWFKEVEKLVAVPSTGVNEKWEMFRGQHKELQKNGEEWMKRTASSCMLVVTLIATVVYTAAFTLPGGNNQETGVVIFKHKNGLQVFLILDTLALMSSTISILIFLSILTSRVTLIDFFKSLPRKFFWGLATLLISIAFMNMAFCTAFFLHYDSYKSWTPWFVSALAVCSFIVLFCLEYSLLTEAYVATFSSVFNPRRRNLF